VIPEGDVEDDSEPAEDKRSSKQAKRPAFSLPLMTNNFRRFNARYAALCVLSSAP